MKTVKFITTNEQERKFASAVRRNVNDYFTENALSKKGNTFLVVQSIVLLAIYILPFVIILTIPISVWLALLMTVLIGIGMAGVGMCIMHDGVHGAYSKKEWVNNLAGSTMYLLGSTVTNWKIQHNVLHHTYTNIEGNDEDIGVRGPLRLSEHAPRNRFHRFQYIYAFLFYGLMTISKLTKDFSQLARYNREGLTKQQHVNTKFEYFKMISIKLIYLFVFIGLPILFTEFSWWQVLIGFFVIHWVGACIMSTIFQMAHVVEGAIQPLPDSEGIIENEWAVHELKTTSDFARNNVFLNWYAGGLNFQIEHHLFPSICHVHYRNIAPIVENTAKEFGLVYNLKPTFKDALFSHLRRLKELGR
ncbi:acyl-CoA desaturase [Chryseotalea sanaruensis]|uniref:Acyl-CoA desaturase n=1 Tax=Chryseotalea sanaruensis TaxID=2482724 RepID=A0A401U640_9BACT|nr:acyl-CoA desaturase [Chryseotalea sanaruensis]GCC50398.1 acyl-CoA desaturase [Chryseotalea sanaruensis]